MMLAACRPSVVRGGPKTRHSMGNGRKTCALPGTPPNHVPHGPMEKQGSNDAYAGAGRRHGFRPIAKARAMACGSNPRALPDLMAAANAADPEEKPATHRACFLMVKSS